MVFSIAAFDVEAVVSIVAVLVEVCGCNVV